MKKKIEKTILGIILIAAVLYSSAQLFYNEDVSTYFLLGHKVILTNSEQMNKEINKHDIMIVKSTPFQNIKEQDIIYYNMSGSLMVHRVVDVNETEIEGVSVKTVNTQGDNQVYQNPYAIEADNYLGKVILIINPFIVGGAIAAVVIMGFVASKVKGGQKNEEII